MSIRQIPWFADILREVYDQLDQREDEPQDPTWELGEIVRLANRVQDDINREMQSVSRRWNMRIVDTSTISSGDRRVDLPDDCRAVRLVTELDAAGEEEIDHWLPGREEDVGRKGCTFIHLPDVNQIYLTETPSTSATLRIWYQPYTPPIVHGIAQTAGSQSIQLGEHESYEDDIYNALSIYVYKGTGAGQTATISDYIGWSHVATLSALWSTTPDSTSYYTSRPSLPKDADLAFMYGLLCALSAKNSQEQYGQFLREREVQMAKLKKAASTFEQAGPMMIQNLMPGSALDPTQREW